MKNKILNPKKNKYQYSLLEMGFNNDDLNKGIDDLYVVWHCSCIL